MLISRQPQKIARAPECLAKKLAVVATPTTFLSRSMQEEVYIFGLFFSLLELTAVKNIIHYHTFVCCTLYNITAHIRLITPIPFQIGIYLCPKLNFAASPFQQETSDEGKYISAEVFDFQLQFVTMTGRPSLSGILQTRPRIDASDNRWLTLISIRLLLALCSFYKL